MVKRFLVLLSLAWCIGIALADNRTEVEGGTETDPDTNGEQPIPVPTPKATANDTESYNNTTTTTDETADLLSSLYISTLKPAPNSSLRETVFKDGVLVGAFNSCRVAEDNAKLLNTSACFIDDAFNDRISFEISFGSHRDAMEKLFKDHAPKLELLAGSSQFASATASDAEVDSSIGRISVSYRCNSGGSGLVQLKLLLRFGDKGETEIGILWAKQCESGVNSKIEFGYSLENHAKDETEHHPFGSDSDDLYTVVPSDKSTEVYAKLLVPGAQQEFLAPYVASSDSDTVQVAVRGNHPNGSILKGLEVSVFQVSYECLRGKGEAIISASVAIPPFQNLSASWKKECGASYPKHLSIGSSEGSLDIVDKGKPTPKYMVGIDNIGTPHSEAHLHLPSNQSDWTIYLTYGDPSSDESVSKDASIQLGRVGVTVEHPDVMIALGARVSKKGSVGWSKVENAENVIRSGDKYRISFRFVCRKKGESRLLITLPLVHYDMLEFGIAKECDHAEAIAHRSDQFVLTVGQVFWVFVALVVGGAAVVYVRRKRKASHSFAPVSTAER